MKKSTNEIVIGIILMLFIFINDFSNIRNWTSGESVGYNIWAIFLPTVGLIIFVKGILDYKK
jgi:hypothetical protein